MIVTNGDCAKWAFKNPGQLRAACGRFEGSSDQRTLIAWPGAVERDENGRSMGTFHRYRGMMCRKMMSGMGLLVLLLTVWSAQQTVSAEEASRESGSCQSFQFPVARMAQLIDAYGESLKTEHARVP